MKQVQRGFTLIELVMVIVILGVLSAVAIPKFVDLKGDANLAAAKAVAGALSSASAINKAGCVVHNNVSLAGTCALLPITTATCASIGALMGPPITFTAGAALPDPTVQGTYYIVTDSALTLAGQDCILVMGDGSTGGVTSSATHFTGFATN